MMTAQVADFPMIFRFGAPLRKSGWQSLFGCCLFGRTCFLEIVGTCCSSQRFSWKALRLHVGL